MVSESAPPRLEDQGAHTLVFSAVAVGLGFALNVLITRTFGADGKGILDVATTTATLFALVLGCSANSTVTHLVARENGLPRRLIPLLLALGGVAGLLAAFLLTGGSVAMKRLGMLPPTDPGFWSPYIGAVVAVSIWSGALRGCLVGTGGMVLVNRSELATRLSYVLALAGLLAAARFGHPRTQPAHFALASLAIAGGVVAWYAVRTARFFRAGPIPWRPLLAFSLPVHATNILNFLNHRADVFFLSASRGTAEVGVYTLAVGFAQLILVVAAAFAQPLLPQVSAIGDARAAALATARICRLYLTLATSAAIGLALAVPPLLPLVFGPTFAKSGPPLLMLLPGVIAFGLVNILISYFAGIGRGRLNFGVSLISVTITLGGNAWLVPRLGAAGAAMVSTASYGTSALLSACLLGRYAQCSAVRLLCPRQADWIAAFSAVSRVRP